MVCRLSSLGGNPWIAKSITGRLLLGDGVVISAICTSLKQLRVAQLARVLELLETGAENQSSEGAGTGPQTTSRNLEI